jgi:hypothetical protein
MSVPENQPTLPQPDPSSPTDSDAATAITRTDAVSTDADPVEAAATETVGMAADASIDEPTPADEPVVPTAAGGPAESARGLAWRPRPVLALAAATVLLALATAGLGYGYYAESTAHSAAVADGERLRAELQRAEEARKATEATLRATEAKVLDPAGYALIKDCVQETAAANHAFNEFFAKLPPTDGPPGTIKSWKVIEGSIDIRVPEPVDTPCMRAVPYLK